MNVVKSTRYRQFYKKFKILENSKLFSDFGESKKKPTTQILSTIMKND